MLCAITGYAQEKKDTSSLTAREIYTDVKTMLANSGEAIKNFAAKLEGPAKHVYHVYIWQQRAEAIGMLVAFLVTIFAAGIVAKWMWGMSDKTENEDAKCTWCIFSIISGLISAGVTVALVIMCSTIFTMIVNPEYHAIKEIIETIK